MKRFILPALLVIVLFACSDPGKQSAPASVTPKPCAFSDADSLQGIGGVACASGIYGMVDDSTLLVLEAPEAWDTCYTIVSGKGNVDSAVRVIRFRNSKASFTNSCTDMIDIGYRPKTDTIFPEEAVLLLSSKPDTADRSTRRFRVEIRKLNYVDRLKHTVRLSNKQTFEVTDLGRPG